MKYTPNAFIIIVCILDYDNVEIGDMVKAKIVYAGGSGVWLGDKGDIYLKACWRAATQLESDLYYQKGWKALHDIPNL